MPQAVVDSYEMEGGALRRLRHAATRLFCDARRHAPVKPGLAVLLLALGLWGCSRFHGQNAPQQQFVDRLFLGVDDNVALTPVLAHLSLGENVMFRGNVQESKAMYAAFPRILRGEGAKDDFLFVTGSNWVNLACIDDCRGTLLGAAVWRKAVEAILRQPDRAPVACAGRLRYWPPALQHLGLARTFDREFISAVINQVARDAGQVSDALAAAAPDASTFSMATALYEAGANFHAFGPAGKWRDCAERAMCRYFEKHQKADGSVDGDLSQSMSDIEAMIRALAVGYRAGLPVSNDLAVRAQKLLDVMMLTLDMDGGLPFRDPGQRFFNKREWMFWGSRIFNRRDYAWIGYGGLDAMNALPPARTNAFFADMGLGVMRNNWDIRWYQQRGEQAEAVCSVSIQHRNGTTNSVRGYQFNHFSNVLRLDCKKGVVEAHAFGEQQMQLKLPWTDVELVKWVETPAGVTFTGRKGAARICVTQPTDANAWVVRVAGVTTAECFRVAGLHAGLRQAGYCSGMVTRPEYFSPRVEWSTVLRIKPVGSVCLKTDGVFSGYDGTNVEVRAGNGNSVTLVMLGAAGVWVGNWNNWPTPPPDIMAEGRQTTFAPDGCSFETWASKLPETHFANEASSNLTVSGYNRPGNRRYDLIFDEQGVTTHTNSL